MFNLLKNNNTDVANQTDVNMESYKGLNLLRLIVDAVNDSQISLGYAWKAIQANAIINDVSLYPANLDLVEKNGALFDEAHLRYMDRYDFLKVVHIISNDIHDNIQ